MQYVNRAKHLVFLPLNTGDTLHLAPGEVSRQLEPHEAERNTRLERLAAIGVIQVVAESKPSKPSKAAAKNP